jgi:hypothetical protein
MKNNNRITHSKYKNTGILFELLVRQITSDTLSGKDSKAINLLKTYFTKTELGREYRLYETITKSKTLSEARASIYLNTTLDNSKAFNRSALKRQKYNLINEIKSHYDLNTFFGSQIKNYKETAALYTLIEGVNSKNVVNNDQLIANKITILEFLTKKEITPTKDDEVLAEFITYDKDIRSLTYRILLEKFNEKYDGLCNEQKQVLKEFINSVDSTPGLRIFYNTKINELKNSLKESINDIKDSATKVKITEISKFLVELNKTDKVDNNNLVDLLQYYELVNELKRSNGI